MGLNRPHITVFNSICNITVVQGVSENMQQLITSAGILF